MEYSDDVSKIISAWEGVIQIAYNMESDALIAAATFGKSFYDLDKPCVMFEIEKDTNLKKLIKRNKLPTIILGLSLSAIKDDFKSLKILSYLSVTRNSRIGILFQKISRSLILLNMTFMIMKLVYQLGHILFAALLFQI